MACESLRGVARRACPVSPHLEARRRMRWGCRTGTAQTRKNCSARRWKCMRCHGKDCWYKGCTLRTAVRRSWRGKCRWRKSQDHTLGMCRRSAHSGILPGTALVLRTRGQMRWSRTCGSAGAPATMAVRVSDQRTTHCGWRAFEVCGVAHERRILRGGTRTVTSCAAVH